MIMNAATIFGDCMIKAAAYPEGSGKHACRDIHVGKAFQKKTARQRLQQQHAGVGPQGSRRFPKKRNHRRTKQGGEQHPLERGRRSRRSHRRDNRECHSNDPGGGNQLRIQTALNGRSVLRQQFADKDINDLPGHQAGAWVM